MIFYCDHFVLPLPPGHRFPMEKYSRLRAGVAQGLPGGRELLHVPEPASDGELMGVHTPAYHARVVAGTLRPEEVRRIGFPWSPELVERSRRSVGGTVAAARTALQEGVGVNLAGGTHHAFAHRGEGFCVFNDVAVAVRTLQGEGRLRRAAVVDLDVHQGNGTASIFRGDRSVFTVSVHGAGNFPFWKERSDLDLELPDRTGDAVYLEAVRSGVSAALGTNPELLFYLAGADPYEGDRLGRLSVTREGLAERDRIVFGEARRAGVAVAVSMAGGYASKVEDTVAIHLHTVAEALRVLVS